MRDLRTILVAGIVGLFAGAVGSVAAEGVGNGGLDGVIETLSAVANGTWDMNGNDLVLDADGDSRMELGTDDTLQIYFGNGPTLRWTLGTTGTQAANGVGRYTVRDASADKGTATFSFNSNTGYGLGLDDDNSATSIVAGDEIAVAFAANQIGTVAAAPSEPHACAAATEWHIVGANKTDEAATGELCACLKVDASTYDWINILDGTACAYF